MLEVEVVKEMVVVVVVLILEEVVDEDDLACVKEMEVVVCADGARECEHSFGMRRGAPWWLG